MKRHIIPLSIIAIILSILPPQGYAGTVGMREEFDYADAGAFEAVWGKPLLGGHLAQSCNYSVEGGRLTVTQLVDSTGYDHGFATATFSRPASLSGDFDAVVDLAWDLVIGPSSGHVAVEFRDANGIIASCGMMDDMVYADTRGLWIAAWGQVGGSGSLYFNDIYDVSKSATTNGIGAIAASWVASSWGWRPKPEQVWYKTGQATIKVARRGKKADVSLIKDDTTTSLVQAEGSGGDLSEVRIRFMLSDFSGIGYPNPTYDVDGLSVRRIEISPPVQKEEILIDQANNAIVLSEPGQTSERYSVKLSAKPKSDVVVMVKSDSQTLLDTGHGWGPSVQLVFDEQTWSLGQTVLVKAVDDHDLEFNHISKITHTASSRDIRFDKVEACLIIPVLDDECGAWGFDRMDFNRDCRVDAADLAQFAESWLTPALPSPTDSGHRRQAIDVGMAKIDITPTTAIRLNGYAARCNESAGIQERLWAKALSIGSAQNTCLLITVDATGLPRDMTTRIRNNLVQQTGIAPERIAFAATHTHSGPVIKGYLTNLFAGRCPITAEQQVHIDQYSQQLEMGLQQVALEATQKRSPSLLFWHQGEVDFAANRRTPGGPVDHDLPILKVTDLHGAIRAIVVSYACHGTTLDMGDNLVSGDWIGYAQEYVEKKFPGSMALVLIGTGADSDPGLRGELSYARQQGQEIADEVEDILGRQTPIMVSPNVRAATGTVYLNFDDENAKPLPYTVQSWTFGDSLAIVFLEGEVVADYAHRLKGIFRDCLRQDRLWVNAYCNSVPGYIPSERVLREGGYEPVDSTFYYGLPGPFALGLEDQIVSEILQQTRDFLKVPVR
jgi:hypothetical protein